MRNILLVLLIAIVCSFASSSSHQKREKKDKRDWRLRFSPSQSHIQKKKNKLNLIRHLLVSRLETAPDTRSMGETVIVITNGAEHANTSSDSSTLSSSQDDKPPIAEPPDISAIEKPQCPHTLPARRVAELLDTHIQDGLSDQEAAARLARDGPNTIKGAKGISIWEIFLQQVANALTVVLIAVMALSFAIHDFVEGGVVLAVILLNIIVGYVAKKIIKTSKTDVERKRPSRFISFPSWGSIICSLFYPFLCSRSHDLFEYTG